MQRPTGKNKLSILTAATLSLERLSLKTERSSRTRWSAKLKTKQKPLTVTGLAVALGTSRDVLLDYETTYSEKYPEFSNTIKEAKEQIKAYAEESLFGTNTAGVIFSLKNNWGFKDKYETENTNREVKFINTVPRTPEIMTENSQSTGLHCFASSDIVSYINSF